MENNFNYQLVPHNYAHCFNEQCTRGAQCLRYLAAQNSTSQYNTLHIVNPKCIPNDMADCSFFKSTQKVSTAWGIRRLLDNVPHKKGTSMRKQLISYFGKNAYYRIYHLERGLSPAEQEYIRQLFHKNDIVEKPQFEKYTEEFEF